MKILRASDRNFRYEFEKILKRNDLINQELETDILKIIDDVRLRGDKALISYTSQWDNFKPKEGKLAVTRAEIKKAYTKVKKEDIKALELASSRIEEFYKKEPIPNFSYEKSGITLGQRYTAIESVGVYVPGGKASYPSSVLMNALPAKVAGVKRISMTTPFVDGNVEPIVLVAADIAGIKDIYKVGGAHAIAALTYGTSSVSKVDKIVGPGNIYVNLAKKLVFGLVGVDMFAGPTEIGIIADDSADPRIIAADLMSQAEHDEFATCVLLTFNVNFAHKVDGELRRQLRKTERKAIAEKSIKNRTFIIVCKNEDSAAKLCDEIAPEHLELAVKNPEALCEKINNAGAIFLGHHSPVVLGDYLAGPSHVLPTAGTARFSSPLRVIDFLKASSLISFDEKAFNKYSSTAIQLAEMESLSAHAESVKSRIK